MIAERFEADLPATFTFDYPTLSAIASYLAEHAAPVAGPADTQLAFAASSGGALEIEPAQAGEAVTALVGVSARYPGDVTGKWGRCAVGLCRALVCHLR